MKTAILLLLLSSLTFAQIRSIDPPSAKESGMPYLGTSADGTVYLSYIDYLGTEGHALRFTKWTGSTWGPTETIAQGKNWFVNWADFPSIAAHSDGSMLAHWLTRSAPGNTYGYGIRVAKRDPKLREWKEVYGMSLEEPKDYAGFLSFLPNSSGAIYLAPPKPADVGEGHRKTVRYVSFSPEGAPVRDVEIDSDACSCCQTAIASTPGGLIAAYRDHLPGEIRDISIVRFADGAWTEPRTLHSDGWKINGCPTDGPSVATVNKNVGIAWLTRAGDLPKVQVALSIDGGTKFSSPIRIDDGNPLGRAALTSLDTKSYLAVWIEKTSVDGKSEIRLRRIDVDGAVSKSIVVASVSTGRNTGFPKVAVTGDQILVAWRDGSVRTSLLAKSQITRKDLK
ncbi:MAG: hypothetical protein ACK5TN_18665 [Acidobacteriota bacterium]|jgi:hypothetical protein